LGPVFFGEARNREFEILKQRETQTPGKSPVSPVPRETARNAGRCAKNAKAIQ
jgi:hypothetical protein